MVVRKDLYPPRGYSSDVSLIGVMAVGPRLLSCRLGKFTSPLRSDDDDQSRHDARRRLRLGLEVPSAVLAQHLFGHRHNEPGIQI